MLEPLHSLSTLFAWHKHACLESDGADVSLLSILRDRMRWGQQLQISRAPRFGQSHWHPLAVSSGPGCGHACACAVGPLGSHVFLPAMGSWTRSEQTCCCCRTAGVLIPMTCYFDIMIAFYPRLNPAAVGRSVPALQSMTPGNVYGALVLAALKVAAGLAWSTGASAAWSTSLLIDRPAGSLGFRRK